jgi:hypothetical protein
VGTRPALIFVVTQCLEQAQVPVGEELEFPGPCIYSFFCCVLFLFLRSVAKDNV